MGSSGRGSGRDGRDGGGKLPVLLAMYTVLNFIILFFDAIWITFPFIPIYGFCHVSNLSVRILLSASCIFDLVLSLY